MNPFDHTEFSELPEIGKVKACLQRIVDLGEKIKIPISNVDKEFADELFNLSYAMFCYHKQSKKTFTVCNNSRLKRMQIQPDADGFEDNDTFYIAEILKKDLLNVFAELVSYSYLQEHIKDDGSRLYAAEIYSCYSGSKHTIFFANKNNVVYIFDEELTKLELSDYISNYFSASRNTEPEIEAIIKGIIEPNRSFAQNQMEITETINKFNYNIMNRHGFIFGAITFLDFLGWKGLWQSRDAQDSLKDVSDLIEDFRGILSKLSEEYFVEAKGLPLSLLISISDTIAVFTPKTSTAKICDLLKIHAEFSKLVLEKCCEKQYAIRGAISYGEYSVMKNIMIGPGIDECASWHESGNWIGVHLTPTAQIYWDNEGEKSDVLFKCEKIPLKKGVESGYCVRWNVSKETFDRLVLKNRALLPEIAGKYTNTRYFLQNSVWREEESDGTK